MKRNKTMRDRTMSLLLLISLSLAGAACGSYAPPIPTSPPPLAPPAQTMLEPLPPTATSQSTPPPSVFPNPLNYAWQPVVSGLEFPVDIQDAGDGSGRLFIVERPGRIRILQDGQLLTEPFLDIRSQVESGGQEQGLLGLAFHPRYAENGYFYVNYIDRKDNTVIARFQASVENPNRADASSEIRLLYVEQPYGNHNGGGLAFGPDGYLYIGLGDGGSAGDPQGNGQSLDTLLGKLLRIDVDNGERYAIPLDNPYTNGGGLPEIWAYGLRNPWRFSFDRQTGDLYIGDVGQGDWEEIDHLPAGTPGGVNFGWDYFEGNNTYEGDPPDGVAFNKPIWEYYHSLGCSVTGGFIYRGGMQEWLGIYFYADFCNGNVSGLVKQNGTWEQRLLFETGLSISTFGQDETGEIYLADYRSGEMLRLTNR